MRKLYDILKTSKLGAGAAPNYYTTLMAQSLSKGSAKEREITDIPPISFKSNGLALIDWTIWGNTGGCGERTSNFFDGNKVVGGRLDNGVVGYSADTTDISFSNDVVSFTTRNTYRGVVSDLIPINSTMHIAYTLSTLMTKKLAWYAEDKTFLSQVTYSSSDYRSSMTLTPPDNAKYFRISFEPSSTGTYTITKPKLNVGSTAQPYEPYGYKIGVSCGGETKTIYLDEPLEATDSISMTDTGISIPTIEGSNTLSVGTTIQPSSVYIKYKEG